MEGGASLGHERSAICLQCFTGARTRGRPQLSTQIRGVTLIATLFGIFNPVVQDHILTQTWDPVGVHPGCIVVFLQKVANEPWPVIVGISMIPVGLLHREVFRLVEGPEGPEEFRGGRGTIPWHGIWWRLSIHGCSINKVNDTRVCIQGCPATAFCVQLDTSAMKL